MSSKNNIDRAPTAFLRESLHDLRRAGLYRNLRSQHGAPGPRVCVNGRNVLLLCSNNYLGLAMHPAVRQASAEAIEAFGCGATGSRLISGNVEPYELLERDLASFKGTEAALVFASGYHANAGAVSALAGAGDVIFSDALNHASVIDGCRLSRAETVIYRHCDVSDLERKLSATPGARRKLIVTESVFSMDGDVAPLRELIFLAERHGAMLMVDEAHATGVFGPTGAGLVEELGLSSRVHVQMGTFSKSLGSVGGYVAGSRELTDYLIHHARSFIFSTGLPPAALAASRAAIQVVRRQPELRQALWQNVRRIRQGLAEIGFDVGSSQSQIIPICLTDDRLAMAACRLLLKYGVFVQAIRPPTVPPGTARLRLTPTACHTSQDIDEALQALARLKTFLARRGRIHDDSNTHVDSCIRR
jgi:8-amino-7-oxononanoate synthase